jgi:hypothetical protein
MALKQNDFVRAVAKLNELTRSQAIKWKRSNSLPGSRGGLLGLTDLKPKVSFQAVHEGRIVRITQYETETALGFGSHKYILDLRDREGNAAFEFPEVEGISDLFRSVQTQELDIEGFIKSLASA